MEKHTITNMTKIAIFYHNYQLDGHPHVPIEHWYAMYDNQMRSLATSGLLSSCQFVHVGINGSIEPPYMPKAKIRFNPREQWSEGEKSTLEGIRDFCLDESNSDYKVLYIHQKGLKDVCNLKVQDWRLMMEYYLIHKWKDCLELLSEYDCVGVNWLTDCFLGKYPHFSGNFWWANASYIRTLNHSYLDNNQRIPPILNCLHKEFWIGSGKEVKPFCIHSSGYGEGGHYGSRYEQGKYISL